MPEGSWGVCLSSRQQPVAFCSLCRWGGRASCWLSIPDTGWSLLLKAESSLVSLYPIVALSYLVICLSTLFEERRDGYNQEGRNMQLGGAVLSADGERYVSRVKGFPLLSDFLFCQSYPSDWALKSVQLLESLGCSSSSQVLCLSHCQ